MGITRRKSLLDHYDEAMCLQSLGNYFTSSTIKTNTWRHLKAMLLTLSTCNLTVILFPLYNSVHVHILVAHVFLSSHTQIYYLNDFTAGVLVVASPQRRKPHAFYDMSKCTRALHVDVDGARIYWPRHPARNRGQHASHCYFLLLQSLLLFLVFLI